MMKKVRFILVFSLLLMVSSAGFFSVASAQGGLVPDCTFLKCNVSKLLELIGKILNWIVLISMPLAGIAIVWAGITMVLYSNNPGKRESALEVLKVAGIGLIFVLAAYVIVKTLADFFIGNEALKSQINL